MAGYSGAHQLRREFRYDEKTRVRQGGAWTETYAAKSYHTLVLMDADARMVQLANARSQQVSHQALSFEPPFAKSGDRLVLSEGPQDRYFYVQTLESMGPSARLTQYALMERMS